MPRSRFLNGDDAAVYVTDNTDDEIVRGISEELSGILMGRARLSLETFDICNQ